MKRICLVTSAHISYNPRLIKEADALSAAGFDVRVVALSVEKEKAAFDAALKRGRGWRWQTWQAGRESPLGRWRWLRAACRQRFYEKTRSLGLLPGVLERAYSRYYPELTRLAAREPADLYIAHNLPALPVASAAARRWNAKLGFDAEDFHRGEFAESPETGYLRELTKKIEEKYIPLCDLRTAASGGIAAAYAEVLRIPEPVTILNVFPRSERAGQTPPEALQQERHGSGLSLYWYSQVIGPDRGLGDAIEATAILREGIRLHVRGACTGDGKQRFSEQVERYGIQERVHVLPPVPPEQLIERAAQHDVGLALEPGNRPNNRLAASNKLCAYFLAGLAIAATDVPGQRAILTSRTDAGFLYQPGDAESLARQLHEWRDNRDLLASARAASLRHGNTSLCWEAESGKLIQLVESVFK